VARPAWKPAESLLSMVRRKNSTSGNGANASYELHELEPALFNSPSRMPDPPIDPRVALLPFHEGGDEGWDRFEKVCVAVAQDIDGLHNVQRYGIRGQRQYGLDLVGWDDARQAVVYQAKHYAMFHASDLRNAVEAFANGPRPFDARRLVICVASEARRTKVVEEFARLRSEHPDLDIDLYDQERLSEKLRGRPDLVRRFFGDPWRDRVCLIEAPPTRQEPAQRHRPDELLRGPLRALELDGVAQEAEAVLESAPESAARLFAEIADRLEARNYPGHAVRFRQRHGEALRRAGQLAEAADTLFDLAWRDVDRCARWVAPAAVQVLEEMAKDPGALPQLGPRVAALQAITRWFADPSDDLSALTSATRALIDIDDAYAPQVGLWLAETALTAERTNVIEALAADLTRMAADASVIAGPKAEALAVRLRLGLAAVVQEWPTLLREASTGRFHPRQAALVLARRGRYLAWQAQPDEAEDYYRWAVDRASAVELFGEAAHHLRAVSTLSLLYGFEDNDPQEALTLAQAIATRGTDTYLATAYDPHDAALEELLDNRLPTALQQLRRYLRETVVSGHFARELDAHELLGDLYVRSGIFELAARHYIRAGKAKKLEQALAGLDDYIDCNGELERTAPWERASALRATAAQGDLVPDGDVPRLVVWALDNAKGARQGPFDPQLSLACYKLLGALAERIPAQHVDDVLALLQPQVERAPNTYRHNDQDHAQTLLGMFLAHETRRPELGARLLDLMAASPDLGQQIVKQGGEVFAIGQELLLTGLRQLADDGNGPALQVLSGLNDPHPALLDEARRRVATELSRPPDPPGTYSYYGSLPQTANLATLLPSDEQTVLARHALAVAADHAKTEQDRSDGLCALGVLARTLPESIRDEVFERTLELARAGGQDSALNMLLQDSLHPLSAMRLDLGVGTLTPTAVRAAADLAHEPQQVRAVTREAILLLRRGDERAVHDAAHALSRLPPDQLQLDARLLASSPHTWLRQLAAVTWSHNSAAAPELGLTLASDRDPSVRRALASSLPQIGQHSAELADAVRTKLASDQRFSVRRLANVQPTEPMR
jgi:tetratricopeptide (TPR) repeat protein